MFLSRSFPFQPQGTGVTVGRESTASPGQDSSDTPQLTTNSWKRSDSPPDVPVENLFQSDFDGRWIVKLQVTPVSDLGSPGRPPKYPPMAKQLPAFIHADGEHLGQDITAPVLFCTYVATLRTSVPNAVHISPPAWGRLCRTRCSGQASGFIIRPSGRDPPLCISQNEVPQ